MSLLAASAVLALSVSPVAAPVPAWDLAGCRKTRSTTTARAGHLCTAAHLDADKAKVTAVLKHPLEAEWRDFLKWLVERGGVETGATAFSLGDLYYNGQGMPRDFEQAAVWYRRAAELGLAGAQFNLGLMYASGDGVPQDFREAHKWLNLAAARTTGDPQSIYVAARDRVAKSMTPDQIGEAQKLTREWNAAFIKRGRAPVK